MAPVLEESLAARKRDLERITEEAQAIQQRYVGKKWDEADAAKFRALCKEGKALQDDIELEEEAKRFVENSNRLAHVPEITMPATRNNGSAKQTNPREVAGYISVGEAVIASDSFREWARQNFATGGKAVVKLAGSLLGKYAVLGHRGEPLIALTREDRQKFEAFVGSPEYKAVPTLGAGVVEPERLARVPQVTANDRLTIRDVLTQGTTNSGSVSYIRHEATTGKAAAQTPGEPKAELSAEWTKQTAPVVTLAGWMPVQNQQIQDFAQLRSLIDGVLRYQVKLEEEEQVIFGDGSADNLEGLLTVTGTQDIAANGRYVPGTTTIIDAIRMGITDVRTAGYDPNAVLMHPIDWETVLLAKGNDDHYIWVVVTDSNGSRIWGLRVVESVGAQERGVVNPRRALIVGDFIQGAQLLDNMEINVQVGLIDDQFVRNMRTILAEERVAFPIYAPRAFAFLDTEAGS